jgi:type II secretory pathway component GspD/PulD (secretin)
MTGYRDHEGPFPKQGFREGFCRRRQGARAFILLALVGLVMGEAAPVEAQQLPIRRMQEAGRGGQEGITLNFQNLDLSSVITAMAQSAGINVVSSNMPAVQVTLRTAVPVTRLEVGSLIRSLALAHGVSVTEEPGFLRLQGTAVQEGEMVEPRFLYIHRLQHANALVLAGTLQALFGGATPRTAATATRVSQTLSQQLQAIEQQSAQQFRGVGTATQAPITVQFAQGDLQGDVQIVPDEITNSLLVRATGADWGVVEQAIKALDLRPLQVVIEVVIAEVRRTGDLSVGMDIFATDVKEEGGRGTTAFLPGPDPGDSFTLSVLRTGNVNVEATLSALSATGNVRILSRPLIQAQNNQEARILVGAQRPFVQVSQVLATDQGTRNEVVQYREVGTALTIFPTINEDGYVNLLLTQEVSSATAETQFGAPIISTREATTQLLARTGQTVVIGGLVDQQLEESRSGIPILKDIPILGYLFGTNRKSVANAELFLFLTPYVIASDDEGELLRRELEGNATLLKELVPLKSMLPPSMRALVPDSILPDTIQGDTISPDTIPPDTIQGDTISPDTIPPDTIRMVRPDTVGLGWPETIGMARPGETAAGAVPVLAGISSATQGTGPRSLVPGRCPGTEEGGPGQRSLGPLQETGWGGRDPEG